MFFLIRRSGWEKPKIFPDFRDSNFQILGMNITIKFLVDFNKLYTWEVQEIRISLDFQPGAFRIMTAVYISILWNIWNECFKQLLVVRGIQFVVAFKICHQHLPYLRGTCKLLFTYSVWNFVHFAYFLSFSAW